jgi:hypothetical protein
MGFDFKPEKLKDTSFRVLVGVRLAVTLITYNIVFGIDNRNRRTAEDTKYYVTLATNKLKVDAIYNEKKFPELDKAVDDENGESYQKACNEKLHKITSRLSYQDVKDCADMEKLYTERLISNKKDSWFKKFLRKLFFIKTQREKIDKAVEKIRNGKVRYEEITADDILIDKDSKRDSKQSLKFDFGKFLFWQNVYKIFTFMASTVIMTIIDPNKSTADIWVIILLSLSLMSGAVVSAIMLSYTYVKIRTGVFDRRNKFLLRRMDIRAEYIVQKKVVENKSEVK